MRDLFLLPFAGGTSLTYEEWKFDSEINVFPLDYKGHGFRMREPLYVSFEEMVKDIADQIEKLRSNYAISIFGHSMGGLVAWDVANLLVQRGICVTNIFVSACLPPHIFDESRYKEMATDNWLNDFLTEYSRIKIERTHSRYYRKNIFPAIKNDYRLISIHKHENIKKMNFNIASFIGENDYLMPSNGMELWGDYTTGKFMIRKFVGSHFYIEDKRNQGLITKTIEENI